MKKSLIAFALTLVLMVLFRPHYVRDVFRVSFQAKSIQHISVILLYTQNDTQKTADIPPHGPYEARRRAFRAAREAAAAGRYGQITDRMFDVSKDRRVTFEIPAEHLYQLKIALNFPQRFIWMGPVTVEGKTKKTFALTSANGRGRGYFQKVTQGSPAAVPFDRIIDAAPKTVFYPTVFAVLFSISFLFFYFLLKSPVFAVLTSAAAGYTAFVFCYNVNFSASNTLFAVLIVLFLYCLYYKTYLKKRPPFYKILAFFSICFGILNILSLSLFSFDSWHMISSFPVLAVISSAGLAVLFYTAGIYFFDFLDSGILLKKENNSPLPGKFFDFYDKHTVLAVFLIILICSLPWHILYYPGFVFWNARMQIRQTLGIDFYQIDQHDPLLSTFLIGGLFRLGSFLRNAELGIYLYILFQTLAVSFIFALCAGRIKKMKTGYPFQAAAIFFFAAFGGFLSIWVIKDYLYGSFLVLFTMQTADLLSAQRYAGRQQIILYGLAFFILCMLRHNGIYIALPASAALLFTLPKKTSVKIGSLVLAGSVLFVLLTKVVFPAMNFKEGSRREALSVPFQQTARYLKYHQDEVTEEEKSVIGHILDTSLISQVYTPGLSDPVKKTYKLTGKLQENQFVKDYFKIWIKMFFKHPGTYLQAFMANNFGYYAFTPHFAAVQPEPFDNILIIEHPGWTYPLRQFIGFLYSKSWTVPFLQLFWTPSFYTWLLLLCCAFILIKRNPKKLIPFLPAGLSILVCLLSPVNGLLRYYLPVIMCMPFLLAFTASGKGEEK